MMELMPFEFVYVAEAFEWGILMLSVRLGGYQPQYFPRLHYFARMLDSDIFTIAGYLQYVRRHAYLKADGTKTNGPSYQAHTIIKTRGGAQELGVPVLHDGFQRLHHAQLDYSTPWHRKHINIIEEQYRRAPYFHEIFPDLHAILEEKHPSLAALNGATIIWGLSRLLEIPARPAEESASIVEALPRAPFRLMNLLFLQEEIVPAPDKKAGRDANDWLIDQCKKFGADEYHFGGTSACSYMDVARFRAASIALRQQDWECRAYPQQHGTFLSNLSIIDLLMNVAPAEARMVLHTAAK